MGEPLGNGISKTFKNHERICDFRGDYFIFANFLRTMKFLKIYIYIYIRTELFKSYFETAVMNP